MNFKIGDHVVVVDSDFENGAKGMVVELNPDNGDDYRVKLDKNSPIHPDMSLTYPHRALQLVRAADTALTEATAARLADALEEFNKTDWTWLAATFVRD